MTDTVSSDGEEGLADIIPFPGTQPVVTESPFADLDLSDPQCLAKRIWNIKHMKGVNAWQKARFVENFIVSYENDKTATKWAWLREREGDKCYLFEGNTCQLYNLDDHAFTDYLCNTYGINPLDKETKQLVASLRAFASWKGLIREVKRFSYWDTAERVLYISGYDRTCYKITGHANVFQGVTFVPNGSGPAIFIDDDGGKPLAEPQLGNHRRLFRELIDDLQYTTHPAAGGLSPAQQRMCMTIWIFMLAFSDYMMTKPLLLVDGLKGSGKTLAIQRIAAALHGNYAPMPVAKKEDPDFPVKILRSPIAILDDINEPVDWIRDTLCTYVTGGEWTRRKLYTNDTQYKLKPSSFIAITTNNPVTFRQDQLADRCLIIRLESRKERDGNLGSNDLLARIQYHRDEIFGEWLSWLNEIVAELRVNTPPQRTRTRLAEFANLAHVVGRVFSRHAESDRPTGDWSPEAVNAMLEAMEEDRNALIMDDDDPTVDLLSRWLEVASNQGRHIRITDLHGELATLAAARHQRFYKTAKQLQQRLREASGALDRHFKTHREVGANNVTIYAFEYL